MTALLFDVQRVAHFIILSFYHFIILLALGTEFPVPALGTQFPDGTEFAVLALGTQFPVLALGTQFPVPALGTQFSVPCHEIFDGVVRGEIMNCWFVELRLYSRSRCW